MFFDALLETIIYQQYKSDLYCDLCKISKQWKITDLTYSGKKKKIYEFQDTKVRQY